MNSQHSGLLLAVNLEAFHYFSLCIKHLASTQIVVLLINIVSSSITDCFRVNTFLAKKKQADSFCALYALKLLFEVFW